MPASVPAAVWSRGETLAPGPRVLCVLEVVVLRFGLWLVVNLFLSVGCRVGGSTCVDDDLLYFGEAVSPCGELSEIGGLFFLL